jgi:hypothetical protein
MRYKESLMRSAILILGCGLSLAGCGAGDLTQAQSDVGRNFDALAHAVAGCAETLQGCRREDDAGEADSDSCRDDFLECRGRAGRSAEAELAEAIGVCKGRHAGCDAGVADCAGGMRACIGEARAQKGERSDVPAPNPHAPTYQCFGQLRECAESATEARECAAEARACVIAAVGDLPERPDRMQPAAAGGGGKGEAGEGGAGGAGGSRPNAGAGAGGSMQPAGGNDCMQQHAACLMAGEEPKTCAREMRMCGKQKG